MTKNSEKSQCKKNNLNINGDRIWLFLQKLLVTRVKSTKSNKDFFIFASLYLQNASLFKLNLLNFHTAECRDELKFFSDLYGPISLNYDALKMAQSDKSSKPERDETLGCKTGAQKMPLFA